jgi:hypothetical protein
MSAAGAVAGTLAVQKYARIGSRSSATWPRCGRRCFSAAWTERMARYFCRMHHGTAYQHFARSRVSLGGLKYMLGAVVTTMLAEKVKTPEQRYLLLAHRIHGWARGD